MKILFCCPSLEAGRDGVGDYTMRLAEELRSQGHECLLVALNDKYLKSGLSPVDDGAINRKTMAVRLSSNENWHRRIAVVQKLVYEFQPDWLSLHYVSFGFHQKGMPIFLASRLRKFGMGQKWHLMFHELWNGANLHSKLSHRLLGVFEKRIVFGLLRKLKPRLCTTSNTLYHHWLNSEKIENQILPIFSNIGSQYGKENFKSEAENAVAIFGQLESEELGRELISAAIKMANGRHLKWRVLGIAGPKWGKVLREKGIFFHSSGQLGEEELLLAIRSCRFGLASTNIYRIGKSGSALAMLDNGLPLLVGRSGWVPRHNASHLELPDGCLECRTNPSWDNLPKNNQFKKPPSPCEIAQRFVSLLNAA